MKNKYIPADKVFYEVRGALAKHGCSNPPNLESHATGSKSFLDLVREDDVDSMLLAFAQINSYYYSVLFVNNSLYKSLSKDVAILIMCKRHKLEKQLVKRSFS